jgi:spore germination protein GerM
MPLFKSLLTLALILAIGFFSAGLPIEINNVLYIPIEQSISYSFQPAYTQVTNPHFVTFTVSTTSTTADIGESPEENLRIEAYKEGERIDNFHYYHISEKGSQTNTVLTKDNPLSFQIDISQKTTRLPNGEYLFKFYISSLEDLSPLELIVNYQSNPRYYKSLNYAPSDSIGLTLYFLNRDNNHLVPLTRFVPHSTTILTTTIENLITGADPSSGLIDTAIVPGFNKVYYSGSTVYVDIDSRSDKLDDSSTLFYALDSVVYTMTRIQGMKRVQFLLDGKRVEEIRPGISTGAPWSPDTNPAAYLMMNTFDRYLLFPYRPDTSEAKVIRDYAYILFNNLKSGIENDPHILPVIPDNVDLLNVYYLSGTITLDFNRAFLKAYEDDRQMQYVLLDSILFTFSEIPGVSRIKILVEGDDQHTFADNRLASTFTRPLYINPEKN